MKGIPAALDLMGPRLDMEVNKERVADLLMAAVRPTMESSAEWREFELIEGPQVKLDVFPIAGDVQRAAVDFEITFRLEHQFYSTEQLKLIDEVEALPLVREDGSIYAEGSALYDFVADEITTTNLEEIILWWVDASGKAHSEHDYFS